MWKRCDLGDAICHIWCSSSIDLFDALRHQIDRLYELSVDFAKFYRLWFYRIMLGRMISLCIKKILYGRTSKIISIESNYFVGLILHKLDPNFRSALTTLSVKTCIIMHKLAYVIQHQREYAICLFILVHYRIGLGDVCQTFHIPCHRIDSNNR